MKLRSKVAMLLAVVFLGFASFLASANDMGKVTITSPKNGQVFKTDKVMCSWTLDLGKEGNHVHLYLDGDFLGPKYGKDYTLENLKPGKHSVELRLATKNHRELGPKADVEFNVKG